MTLYDPIARIPSSDPVQIFSDRASEIAGRLTTAERAAAMAALANYAPWVFPDGFNTPFSGTTPNTDGEELRYYRDPVGRVYMEGKFQSTGSDPDNQIIFSLPLGYRPDRTVVRSGVGIGESSPIGSTVTGVTVTVFPNGDVKWGASAISSSTYELWITDLQFRAVVNYGDIVPPSIDTSGGD